MKFPHHLLILGAIFGSSLLTLFGVIVTAGAAPAIEMSAPSVNPADQVSPNQAEQAGSIPDAAAAVDNPVEVAPAHTAGGECQVSQSFPESILQWCDLITAYASQHQVEPNLVASMMLQESGGDPLAYSSSGAVGLMQVMPRDGLAANFWCVNGPCFASRPSIEELQDPAFNIEYGTRMISGLIERTGSVRDALKSYGPKDVGYYYADIVLSIMDNHQ